MSIGLGISVKAQEEAWAYAVRGGGGLERSSLFQHLRGFFVQILKSLLIGLLAIGLYIASVPLRLHGSGGRLRLSMPRADACGRQ